MSVVAHPSILSMSGSRHDSTSEQNDPSSSILASRRSSGATSTSSRSGRPTSAQDLQVFDYNLVVRQQPKQARICSGTDKQPKGPVDPPPVVRLQISRGSGTATSSSTSEDETGQTSLTSASLIQSPYLFCFAALCKTDSEEEVYLGQDGRTKIVTGNVVSSLYHLRDPKDGSAEGFFVFPDIGVRSEGTFRLKFSLYEMVDSTVFHCKTVFTEAFEVYSAKRYPGTEDSTELSKSFASQGLKMRIKGGSARAAAKLPAESAPRPADNLLPVTHRVDTQAAGLPAKRPASPEMQTREPVHVKRRVVQPGEEHPYYHQQRPPYRSYEAPLHYTDPHQPQESFPPHQPQYTMDNRSGPRSRDFAIRPSIYAPPSSYGTSSRPSTAPATPLTPAGNGQYTARTGQRDWLPPHTHSESSNYHEMPPPPRPMPFPPTVTRSYSDYRPRSSTDSYRNPPAYQHPPAPSRLPFASSLRGRPGSSGGMFKLPSLAEVVPAEECLPSSSSHISHSNNGPASPPQAGELPRPHTSTASSLQSILNPYEAERRTSPPPAGREAADEDSRYFANGAKLSDTRNHR